MKKNKYFKMLIVFYSLFVLNALLLILAMGFVNIREMIILTISLLAIIYVILYIKDKIHDETN